MTWKEERDLPNKRQTFAKNNMFLLKGVEFHTKMNTCMKNEIFYLLGPFLHSTSHMIVAIKSRTFISIPSKISECRT